MTAMTPSSPTRADGARWDEIVDGVVRISVPVPFKGLRQVNLWLLEDVGGWTMIDCGWGDAASRDALTGIWRDVMGKSPLVRLIVTHFHPDHIGNCKWICDQWGLVPMLSRGEWAMAQVSDALGWLDNVPRQERFFRWHGLGDAQALRYRNEFLTYADGVELPDLCQPLDEGDRLTIGGTDWQVMTGGGHSPEMVMLHAPSRELFIAGDQLLPGISSNVAVGHWSAHDDPLQDYLDSLTRLAEDIPPATLVLPGHRDPFRDAGARARELIAHHDERLDLICAAMDGKNPMTAADFLPILFSASLDGVQIGFAIGEVIAHLNRLLRAGRIAPAPRADGRLAFVTV